MKHLYVDNFRGFSNTYIKFEGSKFIKFAYKKRKRIRLNEQAQHFTYNN